MAQVRMITRTVSEVKATVMTVNIKTQAVGVKKVSISATVPEEKRLTVIAKTYNTEDVKIVTITAIEVCETLYGMPEQEFLKFAKVLPPRTKAEE